MLIPETPFPYPGSYALHVDTDLAPQQQQAELVRIMWRREGQVAVSFPLRLNASGNKVIAADALIDATPLTAAEALEFHDLDRSLAGRSLRTAKQKRQAARRDALKQHVVWAPHMERLLRRARTIMASQQRAA